MKIISKKTFDFGKIDYTGRGRKDCPVAVEVELREEDGKVELSIVGEIWNCRRTDCHTCGQCLDTIKKFIGGNSLFKELYGYWSKYHLNGMHAGTHRQEKALQEAGFDYTGAHDYDKACDYLRKIGLFEDTLAEGESARGHSGNEPLKYGHAWIHWNLPADVFARLVELTA